MIILFEGLDKSGKSTLIRNFQDMSGIPSFKNTVKPTAKLYDQGFVNGTYFGAYHAAKISNKDMIFDRSHITELAYAQVKRGYRPSLKTWLEWEELNSHWVVIVYVDSPLETIKERFKTDQEEYVKEEEIEAIAKRYENYFKKSKLSLVYIDGSLSKQRMLTQLVIQLQNLGIWTSMRNR
jgi:thymidylate kinase